MRDSMRQDQELLDAYWDALVDGEVPPPHGVDPEISHTIAHLQALYDSPILDQQFRARLRDDLLNTDKRRVHAGLLVMPSQAVDPLPMNGMIPGGTRVLAPPPARLSRNRVSAFVAMLVLVMALAVASLPFIAGRVGLRVERLVTISALDTPILAPLRAPFSVTPLLNLVISTTTSPQAWVQIDQYTFPPDAALIADTVDGGMSDVYYVAEGAIEVVAGDVPRPVRVVRAGESGAEEALASGETATLTAGDAVVIPEYGAITMHNATEAPTIALHLLQSILVPHPTNRDVDYQSLVSKIRNLQAPVTLALDQVTLAPGAMMPGPDRPGITQLAAPIDQDRAPDAVVDTSGALHNQGATPLEAYVLRVSSSAGS